MSLCLVEQLFRQKVGFAIDPELVSALIWPYLFRERHIPRTILQDIHLVREADPNGKGEDKHSVIITREPSWIQVFGQGAGRWARRLPPP